jgi:hypothetical protein
MITVTTETGSVYEFDLENMLTRRLTKNNFTGEAKLRKDDTRVPLVTIPEIEVGRGMIFVISLREDDVVTTRYTSHVTSVDYGDHDVPM